MERKVILWMLTKSIRWLLVRHEQYTITKILWDESRRVFYEDNVATTKSIWVEELDHQAELTLLEVKRKLS